MFNFYSDVVGACTSIVNLSENMMETFLAQSQSNSKIYSASISNVVISIINNAKNLANVYDAIFGVCNSLVNEINNLN